MKIHRFYIDPKAGVELKHDFWLHDEKLIHQWRNVLRFAAGQQIVLFDGRELERLYSIDELNEREAHLQLITDYARKTPAKEIYLFWSLLKKDKNDWVLQKCTELGVSHFVPLLADRSEKTGFNSERAKKIVIEAAEQCGRSDIPAIREPMTVETAINDYKNQIQLFAAEQSQEIGDMSQAKTESHNSNLITHDSGASGVMIGPEGGWSDQEKQLFKETEIKHLNLHDFTLRAETAAITAVTKLLQ